MFSFRILLARELPALLALVLLLGACAREETPEEPPAENPVVGTIRSVSYEYTLHSGPEGTLYTVRNAEGELIAEEVSREVLAQHHPEPSEELNGIWAGNTRMRSDSHLIEGNPALVPEGLTPGAFPSAGGVIQLDPEVVGRER